MTQKPAPILTAVSRRYVEAYDAYSKNLALAPTLETARKHVVEAHGKVAAEVLTDAVVEARAMLRKMRATTSLVGLDSTSWPMSLLDTVTRSLVGDERVSLFVPPMSSATNSYVFGEVYEDGGQRAIGEMNATIGEEAADFVMLFVAGAKMFSLDGDDLRTALNVAADLKGVRI